MDHVAVRPQQVEGEEGPERLNNGLLEIIGKNKKKPRLKLLAISWGGRGGR